MSLIGYTFRSRARPISSTPYPSKLPRESTSISARDGDSSKSHTAMLRKSCAPFDARKFIIHLQFSSSSFSSFILLPPPFRVSFARYCRYFQTQHEQPASAMDETMPRDTRRMMEEERGLRLLKLKCFPILRLLYTLNYSWVVVLWRILKLKLRVLYYIMNIVRDVYIFLIFELYIYIVNYSFNYGKYVTYRTYVLSFFIIIITTIWIGRLFIFFKLFFHLVSISIYSSIVLFFYFLKNHSTLSFKYASISRNHVTLSQFRFI